MAEEDTGNPPCPLCGCLAGQDTPFYSGTTSFQINLETDASLVLPGTVVRVYNHGTGTPVAITVAVDYGATNVLNIQEARAAEFLFYVDGSTGKWLVSQSAVVSPKP